MFVSVEGPILHADLDSFYASVEQRDDPRLRGRPVIVGGGVVLAASYEAKARGVRTAMGGRQALRLCPHAIVVPPRMSAYSEASKAVFRVFENTSPLVEGLSIDEAFLDVGGLAKLAGTPAQIAARLRVDVAREVGLPITVGVARTKFLAKVASRVAKPDGLLVVPHDAELEFLHPLPVGHLWGVGKVTEEKLRERGITHGRAGRRAGRVVPGVGARPRRGASPARAGPQPGPAAGAGRQAAAVHGCAAGAGQPLPGGRRAGRDPDRAGRQARPQVARREPGLPHGDAAAALPRLHPGDAVAQPAEATAGTADDSRRGARAVHAALPLIRDRGLTLIGASLSNLDNDDAVQLPLPFDEACPPVLDLTVDSVRDRFGSTSITRAGLLGHDPGIDMPLLPD